MDIDAILSEKVGFKKGIPGKEDSMGKEELLTYVRGKCFFQDSDLKG